MSRRLPLYATIFQRITDSPTPSGIQKQEVLLHNNSVFPLIIVPGTILISGHSINFKSKINKNYRKICTFEKNVVN